MVSLNISCFTNNKWLEICHFFTNFPWTIKMCHFHIFNNYSIEIMQLIFVGGSNKDTLVLKSGTRATYSTNSMIYQALWHSMPSFSFHPKDMVNCSSSWFFLSKNPERYCLNLSGIVSFFLLLVFLH